MANRRARGEGAVFYSKAKGCWVWRAIVGHKPDGSVRYKQGRARTQGEALKKKQKAEQAKSQPHAEKETVGEHLQHWLENVAKPTVRPNSWTRYEEIVRLHLKPNIGGHPLRTLTVGQVTKLWAKLGRDGVKPGTVKSCAEVLATALECAVAEEKIATAPTRNAAKPKVRRRPVEVFTDDEVKKLLAAAVGDRHEAIYLLAVGTGARSGEILALDLADVDPIAGLLAITKMLDQSKGSFKLHPPKSESGVRTIDLPAFVLDKLRPFLAGREPGPLFTTRSGAYLRKGYFFSRWKALLVKAGLTHRKFHTTRHTHASRLLAAGVDVAEVARRIGDRIETVHRVYAHWIPTRRDTAAKLDAIYGQGGAKVTDGGGENTKS